MTPDPHKTKLERAEAFEIAAQICFRRGDFVWAKEQSNHAHHLRMEDAQEKKNAELKESGGVK